MSIYTYIYKRRTCADDKEQKIGISFWSSVFMDTGSDFLSMVSVKSVKAGEISPESTPTPIMMFRLEGACTDEWYM